MLCGAAALSFIGCQAPLYDAYKRQDVPALKRGLAAGEDPNATEPANWWWKVPTIPLALAVDVSRFCLSLGTLGLYMELEEALGGSDDFYLLSDYVIDYGSVSVAEVVEKNCMPQYSFYDGYSNPRTCSARDAAVRAAILESGKVNSPALRDWCFTYAISRNDAALARTCLNRGASMGPDLNDKTPLMLAIEAGSGDVARVLMQYGANIHETTRNYSCQFVAQESGQLDLYRSLGGRMVDQPVAPGIPCKACDGTGYVACGRCYGSGKVQRPAYVSTEVRDNYYLTEDVWKTVMVQSGYTTTTCSSCSGSGRNKYSPCPQCNGVGSFSRYGAIPQ